MCRVRMDKRGVRTINGVARDHIVIINLNISLLQMCASGSSDIQEDHSEEQRQEKEDVRVLHGDVTTAYVLGGQYSCFFV